METSTGVDGGGVEGPGRRGGGEDLPGIGLVVDTGRLGVDGVDARISRVMWRDGQAHGGGHSDGPEDWAERIHGRRVQHESLAWLDGRQ